MLSEKQLRELAAEILKKLGEARMEGDDERAKHLLRAYELVVELLAEMEGRRRMWEQFLGDIRSVVEEPPRREGEGEEEIEERRRFARRLYEMAEEGLEEEEDILLRKTSVRKATMPIRKTTSDPEIYREVALEVKEQILQQIDEAISLLDEFIAAFESLTPEQVDFGEPKLRGQVSAQRLQQANINAAKRVKTILNRAKQELEQEGLVKLTEQTDFDLRFWTGPELEFASAVSHFVNWFVKDEETEKRLRDIALKVDVKLMGIGHSYKRYKEYLRMYEDLSRLSF